MTEEFVLTVRGVVEACKKALADRTLGAFHTKTCRYVYQDNEAPALGCAIGVALPDHIRRYVADRAVNGSPVGALIASRKLANPSEADLNVLKITQALHDNWAGNETLVLPLTVILASDMAEPLKAFVVERNSGYVGETAFREWIALLDEMYPA